MAFLDFIFGDGNDTGIAGTGHQRFESREISPDSFKDTDEKKNEDTLYRELNAVRSRKTPQAAGVASAVGSTGTAAQAGPNERIAAANSGATERGSLAQMSNANIARGEDQQMRNYQLGLANALAAQAGGNGVGQQLAESGFNQANDRNTKQMMGLLAAGGGNAALAQRNLMDQSADVAAQNAQNLAMQKQQAALSAQEQLAGVASGARSQDIGVNTDQARLVQDARSQNMSAANNMSQFNASEGNRLNLANAQLAQQANQFNAQGYNDINLQNAGFRQDMSKFNASEANNMSQFNAKLAQDTQLANLDAKLKAQGMNDAARQQYISALLAQDENDRQAMMGYEALATEQEVYRQRLEQAAYENARQGKSEFSAPAIEAGMGVVQGLMGGVGSILSDRTLKTKISLADLLEEDDLPF